MNERKLAIPQRNVERSMLPQRRSETVIFDSPSVASSILPEQEPEYVPAIDRLRAKDSDEWTRWMKNKTPALVRSIRRRVPHRETAEDLVQQAWLRAFDNVTKEDSTVNDKNMNGWLYRIATNLVLDHYKSAKTRFETLTDMSLQPDIEVAPQSVEKTVIAQSVFEDIEAAIQRLTPLQREQMFYYLQDLPVIEAATRAGINEGAVKALRYRAIRSVKRFLIEEGKITRENIQ
jgi:RNA polymerase sigma-70 factor, ECF subfamily